jgi:hypothetical protein
MIRPGVGRGIRAGADHERGEVRIDAAGCPDAASAAAADTLLVGRDIFIRTNRCYYCGRPGFIVWDVDLFSCGREVCESLAFAEVGKRHRNGHDPAPEKRLAAALLTSLATFEHELKLDVDAELLDEVEARSLDEDEREATARVLADLRRLSERYPPARVEGVERRGHRSVEALA